MSEHPIHRLDDDVHQRVRLGILTVLAGVARADFGHLKNTLGVTDGNLGKHLEALASAGYVQVDKVIDGRRPRTWAKITRAGRTALRREVQALQDLLETLVISEADQPVHHESIDRTR
ncbi:transcriptional regulator [Kribbella sp. NPDC006257]|uniref:winged helix-turn-helix domain-containing protein n=1 Tax=Kribbella sp. NPDC006257 TaxID=3156738 RepID=UPI00339DF1D9